MIRYPVIPYDEINVIFESFYESDIVMEENNGSNKKCIVKKIKKVVAWLRTFLNIVSATEHLRKISAKRRKKID